MLLPEPSVGRENIDEIRIDGVKRRNIVIDLNRRFGSSFAP